jgi:putative transposase
VRAFSLLPDSQFTSNALMNAYKFRGKPKAVLFYSDQGMHYTDKKCLANIVALSD